MAAPKELLKSVPLFKGLDDKHIDTLSRTFTDRTFSAGQEITSEGLGKPEPLKDASAIQGNVWIAKDLIEAIEQDRQPLGSMYDGRAALEMILAVYESHRLKGTAELPLKNRKHPLGMP